MNLREQIIHYINTAIQGRKGFFLREEDIQLHLYNYLINTNNFDNVFIEYYVPKDKVQSYPEQWGEKNIYIDIVVEKDRRFYPIEIKYKTKIQSFDINVFGNPDISVSLRQQGAHNIGCYSFWKDIKRLELFETTFEQVEQGIMLFVTNDKSYKTPARENSSYADFAINDQRSVNPGILSWKGDNVGTAKGRPAITTIRDYKIVWKEIKNIANHIYIII